MVKSAEKPSQRKHDLSCVTERNSEVASVLSVALRPERIRLTGDFHEARDASNLPRTIPCCGELKSAPGNGSSFSTDSFKSQRMPARVNFNNSNCSPVAESTSNGKPAEASTLA